MNYLISIANTLMSIGYSSVAADVMDRDRFGENFGWVVDILNAINEILLPIIIVVGSAGTIYAVVIGVNMARADSTEKREEAKKRLINVLVGIAIVVGLILFLRLLISEGGILDTLILNNKDTVTP